MRNPETELEKETWKLARARLLKRTDVPSASDVQETIEEYYDALLVVHRDESQPVSREEFVKSCVEIYETQYHVKKKVGFAYVDEHKPWLRDAKDNIDWFYWKRYRGYLEEKGWSPAAVRAIDKDTQNILDNMADPHSSGSFERRGLVVASVQSGKTSNYIGLITRAADAGYKIIIVMAGVYNVLRNQTQVRIEEGFTGESTAEEPHKPVGVGASGDDARKKPPIAFTSRSDDFGKGRYSPMTALKTAHSDVPYLFVVKKNSNVLKRVFEWLRDYANASDPLLLIDDEADNASINTKYDRKKRDEDDPTRINGQIRSILGLFDKKCYVGYTATPYANILIDPNVNTDEHGPDLFPSGFIYTLEDSTDYFGATKVFADYDEDTPKYLRFIDDIDGVLPSKHKSIATMEKLPESLMEAVRAFLLATAIRGLNHERSRHSTMMVNISPYTNTQRTVKIAIEGYLEQIQKEVNAFGYFTKKKALRNSDELRSLYDTWTSEYKHVSNFTWDEIQRELCETIENVHVALINMTSNDVLEYEQHTEHVIAVGGYRLSRGLTLEGLVVSYYSRNARAYDALMQMARWFGYRFGYEELCRVWMSEEAAGWYKFVSDSTSELFTQLRAMRQEGSTPHDYRLRIRQNPGSLMVTARNKRGAAVEIKREVNLNNGFVETIAFDRNANHVQINKNAVAKLLESICQCRKSDTESPFYQHVSVEHVREFLRVYINEDDYSPASQCKPVLNHIDNRRTIGELEEWDVYVAQGKGYEVEIASGVCVRQEIRFPGDRTNADCIVVGEKHRLASRGVEKQGLTERQCIDAEKDYEETNGAKENTPDWCYRRHRERPLLVIHPVLMRYSDKKRKKFREGGEFPIPKEFWPSYEHEESALGWSISFPYSQRDTEPVEYLVNGNVIDSGCEEDSDDDFGDDE